MTYTRQLLALASLFHCRLGRTPKVLASGVWPECLRSLAYGGIQHDCNERAARFLKIDRAGRCRWPVGFSIGTKVSGMVNSYVFFTGSISFFKPYCFTIALLQPPCGP